MKRPSDPPPSKRNKGSQSLDDVLAIIHENLFRIRAMRYEAGKLGVDASDVLVIFTDSRYELGRTWQEVFAEKEAAQLGTSTTGGVTASVHRYHQFRTFLSEKHRALLDACGSDDMRIVFYGDGSNSLCLPVSGECDVFIQA